MVPSGAAPEVKAGGEGEPLQDLVRVEGAWVDVPDTEAVSLPPSAADAAG